MSGITGQAVGLAVGAAVGFAIGGPAGATAGASVGASAGGFLDSSNANNAQSQLETSALNLQLEQARHSAAEKSAIHAGNFRQALASQVALAGMRGGSGSVMGQFSSASYRNFLLDQQAIDVGLSITEASGGLARADLAGRSEARNARALSGAVSSGTRGLNLNVF